MIVVFDSGVWISAIKFGGTPRKALFHALMNHRIAICAELEEEIVRIIQNKFGVDPQYLRDQLATLLQGARRVSIHGKIEGVCRDPYDDFLLECAETAGASLIVSGDRDLLALERFGKIAILTPRQYLERVSSTAQD